MPILESCSPSLLARSARLGSGGTEFLQQRIHGPGGRRRRRIIAVDPNSRRRGVGFLRIDLFPTHVRLVALPRFLELKVLGVRFLFIPTKVSNHRPGDVSTLTLP
jgi:hypothetical protein